MITRAVASLAGVLGLIVIVVVIVAGRAVTSLARRLSRLGRLSRFSGAVHIVIIATGGLRLAGNGGTTGRTTSRAGGGLRRRGNSGDGDGDVDRIAEVQAVVDHAGDLLGSLALGVGTVTVAGDELLVGTETFQVLIVVAAVGLAGGKALIDASEDAVGPGGPAGASRACRCRRDNSGLGRGRDGGNSDGNVDRVTEIETVVDHTSDFLWRLALRVSAVTIASDKFFMGAEAFQILVGVAAVRLAGGKALFDTSEHALGPGGSGASGRCGGCAGGAAGDSGGNERGRNSGDSDGDVDRVAEIQSVVDNTGDFFRRLTFSIGAVPVASNELIVGAETFQILIGIAAVRRARRKTLVNASEHTLGPRSPGTSGCGGCGSAAWGGSRDERGGNSGNGHGHINRVAKVKAVVDDSGNLFRRLAFSVRTVAVSSDELIMAAEAFQILIGIAAIGCACRKTLVHTSENTLRPRSPGASGGTRRGVGSAAGEG